jgi:MFS family permease
MFISDQILAMLVLTSVAKPRILTPTFATLSATTLCFFLSLGIVLPILPKYLVELGAKPFEIGIVVGALSPTAIILRPVIGRETDRRTRRMFISLGLGLSALACFAYPFATGLVALLAVRLLHGAAIASLHPGAATLIADITPAARRAEAFSYFSMFLHAGSAIGPAMGEFLLRSGGFSTAFFTASALAAVGLGLSRWLREPSRQTPLSKAPLLHRAAAFPALILGLAATTWAAVSAFAPLYIAREGRNSGFFFLAVSATILVLRPFAGRAADRYGRATVITPAAFTIAVAMFTIASGASLPTLLAGAVLFGVGWGALFPALFAMTLDRVKASERGSATGTFTAAFDLSFGAGAALLGGVLQLGSFTAVFLVAGLGALAAGMIFYTRRPASDALFPPLAAEGGAAS